MKNQIKNTLIYSYIITAIMLFLTVAGLYAQIPCITDDDCDLIPDPCTIETCSNGFCAALVSNCEQFTPPCQIWLGCEQDGDCIYQADPACVPCETNEECETDNPCLIGTCLTDEGECVFAIIDVFCPLLPCLNFVNNGPNCDTCIYEADPFCVPCETNEECETDNPCLIGTCLSGECFYAFVDPVCPPLPCQINTIDNNCQCVYLPDPACDGCEGEITGFTLVERGCRNNDIATLGNDDTVVISRNCEVNIRAEVACEDSIRSVLFYLNGSYYSTENNPPYAIAADDNRGCYYGLHLSPGNYSLIAIPYTGRNGTGLAGIPDTISFVVTDRSHHSAGCHRPASGDETCQAEMDGFTLVERGCNNHDIAPLSNYDTVVINQDCEVNIRAEVLCPNRTGSVQFTLNGVPYPIENNPPFALAADDNRGCYFGLSLSPGIYTLIATPYSGNNASGVTGIPDTIIFIVTELSDGSGCYRPSVPCNDAVDCNDGNPCTLNECVGGVCVYTPYPKCTFTAVSTCDDGNPCTEDDWQEIDCDGFLCRPCSGTPIPGCGSSNDLCPDAILIGCDTTISGSTSDASNDNAPSCTFFNQTAAGVWYQFTGTGDSVTVSTCNAGTNYDTYLSVYTGSCNSLVCVHGMDDDGTCGINLLHSTVGWVSSPGVEYFILVHGFSNSTGDFELSLNCSPAIPNGCPGEVTSFTLVQRGCNNVDISPLVSGDKIVIGRRCEVNIRANVICPEEIGSVRFFLNGNHFATENNVPYALAADDNRGCYFALNLSRGLYTLVAVPYSGRGATGIPGIPHTVTFEVIRNDNISVCYNPENNNTNSNNTNNNWNNNNNNINQKSFRTASKQSENNLNKTDNRSVNVFPNPNSGRFEINIFTDDASELVIRLIDIYGKVIFEEIIKDHAGVYQRMADLSTHAQGIYILSVRVGEFASVDKILYTR